jgi:hypothetical protein
VAVMAEVAKVVAVMVVVAKVVEVVAEVVVTVVVVTVVVAMVVAEVVVAVVVVRTWCLHQRYHAHHSRTQSPDSLCFLDTQYTYSIPCLQSSCKQSKPIAKQTVLHTEFETSDQQKLQNSRRPVSYRYPGSRI